MLAGKFVESVYVFNAFEAEDPEEAGLGRARGPFSKSGLAAFIDCQEQDIVPGKTAAPMIADEIVPLEDSSWQNVVVKSGETLDEDAVIMVTGGNTDAASFAETLRG